jgi:hypothetical protein
VEEFTNMIVLHEGSQKENSQKEFWFWHNIYGERKNIDLEY